MPLERQLIALQLCRWQFWYNETLQQTFRPVNIVEIVQKTTNLGNLSPFWGSYGRRRTLVDGSLESPCRVLFKCGWTSFFYLLRLRLYKAKCVKTRWIQEGVGHLEPRFQGGGGRPRGIFFGFYKTRHIWLSDSANCTLLRAVVVTQCRCVSDGQTDRRTDGRTDRRTELP